MGLAAVAMMKSSKYCEYPVACLAVWIEPAVLLNQIHFFFDIGGNLIGYMTWALLAEDTELKLIHDPDVLFHLSEWNEGERLWIMDFVLLDGKLRHVLKEVFAIFPNALVAKSLRRHEDGRVRKVTTWRRRKQ
jgi:cytolysin-activating lysine-acyltransferase